MNIRICYCDSRHGCIQPELPSCPHDFAAPTTPMQRIRATVEAHPWLAPEQIANGLVSESAALGDHDDAELMEGLSALRASGHSVLAVQSAYGFIPDC